MTDWIDGLVEKLDEKQREKNNDRRHELLQAELIDGRGPGLLSEATAIAKNLADELDLKLGATIGRVEFINLGQNGFRVTNHGAVVKIVVTVRLNEKGRQIEVETVRHPSSRDPGVHEKKSLPFIVAPPREVGVEFGPNDRVFEPDDLASRILSEAYTGVVLNKF